MYQREFAAGVRRTRKRFSKFAACTAVVLLAALLALSGAGQANAPQDLEDKSAGEPTLTLPAETAAASAEADPAVPNRDDWRLVLVNRWNPAPDGWQVHLLQLSNGLYVDERCYPDLQAMMDGCRAAGLSPVICSAYRTQETQERLYQNEVSTQLALGLSQEEAAAAAATAVAVPGASEHQLGLALDIVDAGNQCLNESQENTPVQRWLMAHSWEYGFILRYPGGKSDITGIIYEPWHYRYVGRAAAEEIHELGVCLEEYLQ